MSMKKLIKAWRIPYTVSNALLMVETMTSKIAVRRSLREVMRDDILWGVCLDKREWWAR